MLVYFSRSGTLSPLCKMYSILLVVPITFVFTVSALDLFTGPKRAVWRYISAKARAGIVKRGEAIGVNWQEEVEALRSNMGALEQEYERLTSASTAPKGWPEYYIREFHAYEEGNLGWLPALEVGPAALTVHAPIFTGTNKELRKDGDATLRSNYQEKMREALRSRDFEEPKIILDLGSSTGLSTRALAKGFPKAEKIIGADLSPYMLAVAGLERDTKGGDERLSFVYGAGEDLSFMEERPELVSMCLMSHELPESAAERIYAEVFNALPSGGSFSIMDIDPNSDFFRKFRASLAFAGFASTEPWIKEYCSMDLPSRLSAAGFVDINVASNSPRHRTVVAFKP